MDFGWSNPIQLQRGIDFFLCWYLVNCEHVDLDHTLLHHDHTIEELCLPHNQYMNCVHELSGDIFCIDILFYIFYYIMRAGVF